MSSTEYSAALQTDPRLRRIVTGSGVLLGLIGILVILQLPVDSWVRVSACALWITSSIREYRQLQRGWAECHALRFSGTGDVAILGGDGVWHPARRESGGVLLRNVGWIRLRDHRGVVFGELLFGNERNSRDWRRLQVIWRHVGA